MSINVKIADKNGNVKNNLQLVSDPADIDIIIALGGEDTVHNTHILSSRDWEIHRLPSGNGDLLIIGSPPKIHDSIKTRKTCTLTNNQIFNLCKNVVPN